MRRTQAGFVTLAALLIILIITTTGAILLTSLFGEIQGESGYNQATGALALGEAGSHWAVNKMTGTSPVTEVYGGDSNQSVQGASGQSVGVFDVTVTCANGAAVSTGCPVQPGQRLVRATGYVPSKTTALGQRTVQALVAQNTFYNKTLCAYTNVNIDQGVTVQGDVGSEGMTIPDLSLQGPWSNPGRIQPAPGNVQPGNAYAVGTVSCSVGCSTQVAGTVNQSQAPGTICPNRTQVSSSYTCVPGSATLSGGPVTISSSNNSLSTVTLGAGGTVTFQTAGPTDILTVNVGTITAGQNTWFIIQGGGYVQLNVASQLTVGQGSFFGVDGSGNVLPANHLVVRSCNTGTPSPAIWFNQTGKLSAVIIAPYGNVQMDQAQNSQGAVLANNIQFDQGTTLAFDASASAIGFGFNKLLSWQDVP